MILLSTNLTLSITVTIEQPEQSGRMSEFKLHHLIVQLIELLG